MSDAMSEGEDRARTDQDAWASACAEDLAAEKERRRGTGWRPGGATEELLKLADAVVDKLSVLGAPAASFAAQAVISQVKSVGGQLRSGNPEVFDHLTAAGSELLAAYRAAVGGHEERWTRGASPTGSGRPQGPPASGPGDGDGPDDGPDRPGTERIDLD